MKKATSSKLRAAFSLVELLVVITIIAIIAGFAVPAVTGIMRGSALTQASQLLTDQLSMGRQLALSKNRAVEVRIYKYADPEVPGEIVATESTWKFRAFQLFEVMESGVAVPVDKVQRFPDGVVMNSGASFSSLIAGTGQTLRAAANKDLKLPRGVEDKYKYVSFRFRQDGSTDLLATQAGGWFVTINNMNDKPAGPTVPPANFFTLQIDPVSGSTKAFRPTAG